MSILDLELPDALEVQTDGSIRIRGHRVWLYHLLSAIYSDKPEWSVLEAFPTVPAKTLSEVLVFCIRHPKEVRELYERERDAILRVKDERAPGRTSSAELRERMNKKFGPNWNG
jgi:uncharacterized protein (DUF433 family)